jgi:hypothetical protein
MLVCRIALSCVCLLAAAPPPATAQDGWVAPLTTLRPSPGDAADVRLPLEARLRSARQLGRHGDRHGAVAVLVRALAANPPPPLEREVLLALARRADPSALEALERRRSAPGPAPFELFLALAALGAPGVPALLEGLNESAQQAFAAEALRRVGPVAVEPLAGQLHRLPPQLVPELLGALGEPTAIPVLLQAASPATNPELRAAALAALAQLGARQALPLARAPLQTTGADVPAQPASNGVAPEGLALRLAAATALARLGGSAELPLLRQRLAELLHPAVAPSEAELTEAAELLRALCTLDAPGCAPELGSALRSGAEIRVRGAREQLLTRPHPAWLGLLTEELGRNPDPTAVAFALARVPEGAGLPVLLAGIERGTIATAAALAPLAVAVRRGFDSDTSVDESPGITAALARLRQAPAVAKNLALRGLARDPELIPDLETALRSGSAELRRAAAQALRWLGPQPELRTALRAALVVENDPGVFRDLAEAALIQRVGVPLGALTWALANPETAPEALRLAVLAGSSPTLDRRLRRALSDTRGAPRLRVAAALALADLGSPRALPALLAALDDPAERVRLAALRAVAALGDPRLAAALFAHARAELSGELAMLARDLGHALREGRPVPLRLSGDRVLALLAPPDADPGLLALPLEVLLPDGRWLRVAPLGPGEWLVADLPESGVLVWPHSPGPLSN